MVYTEDVLMATDYSLVATHCPLVATDGLFHGMNGMLLFLKE
jgi:hypothetical protein